MKREPELSVEMWYCGDDVCDCSRPEVCLRWDPTTTQVCQVLAQGPFVTQGYGAPEPGELEAQQTWMAEARHWYGVEAVEAR